MTAVSRMLIFLSLTALTSCADRFGTNDQEDAGNREEAARPEAVVRERRDLLTREYAAFRKSVISDVAYRLSLQMEAGSDIFSGQVTIDFTLSPDNTSPVTVDFDSGELLDVRVNGREADYEYERWFITFAPDQFTAGGNTIHISYRRPYSTDGAGLHKFIDPENGEVYLYTNFEPYDANRLFPHFDQPDLKAPLTLDVLAPARWRVIANTRESDITGQGARRRWEFPATPPLSSYVYAMHAGPFTVWESRAGEIPLRLFARNALASYVRPNDWFTPTRQSFAFFQEYFDEPYPFEKYDQVIVPDFNAGAMENVGAVTFNERYVSRGEKTTDQRMSLANVIAHEMAHMWFGNLVTMVWWDDLWLNESFATYMANLELERASGFENVWDTFYSGTKQWAYATDQLVTTHPIALEVPTTSDAFTNFDGITYGKGASMLKQLPYFLGEENFRRGVINYLDKYAWSNTTLDDFVGELAGAAGRDLNRWRRQWLDHSGVNTLQAEFACNGDTLASLRLLQFVPEVDAADKILRTQRTQVGLYRARDGVMVLTDTLPVTYGGSVTRLPSATGLPCPDLVFPNQDDWAYVKVKLDPRSLATLRERINDFPQTSTRIMLWQSLWDGVRDIDMPLHEFTGFALGNIGGEADRNIIRQVTENLSSAFDFYSLIDPDDPGMQSRKARIEDFLRERLDQAEPGSDLQKIWFDEFVSHAHTNPALGYLQRLLNGEETLEGMSLDQDRRWDMVIALNRYLHGNYATVLDTERRRDNSDQGNTLALAAEAIRPERAMKARWLNIAIDSPETYKLATLRTVLAYLFPAEQSGFLDDFADRILAAVPAVNARSDQSYVDAFIGTLMPASCSPESVTRLSRAAERFSDYQPLIVKAFRIALQEDRRCVAIGQLLE